MKRKQDEIEEIQISGHAYAAEPGRDIVCSAVSAVSFGILNSVHHLLGTIPQVETAEQGGGFLRWSLHSFPDDEKQREAQRILAESMIVSLFGIAQQNGKYITIQDPKWQGGAQR